MNFVPSSLALRNAQHYGKLWASVPHFHHAVDGKFQVLEEAFQTMEERSASYYPTILELSEDLVTLQSASPLTALVLTGVNFVGDSAFASAVSDEGSATKELTWTRNIPGDEDVNVIIASSGVENTTVTAVWDGRANTLTVTRGLAATGTHVVNALAIDGDSMYLLTAEATGDNGTGVPTPTTITLTGGKGHLLTLSIGQVPVDGESETGCGIKAVTDTSITFDFDASNLTTETMALLMLCCDGVASTPVALTVDHPTVDVTDVSVTTAKLAAAAVTSAKLDPTTIQYAEVSIASADIKQLFTAAATLVAGQAGKVLEFLGAILMLDFGGTAYDTQGTLQVVEETSGTVMSLNLANSLLFAGADAVSTLKPAATDKVLTPGKGLKLFCLTADPATGNGVLRVKVAYRVHTTGF